MLMSAIPPMSVRELYEGLIALKARLQLVAPSP